jgi:hypothetical protein
MIPSSASRISDGAVNSNITKPHDAKAWVSQNLSDGACRFPQVLGWLPHFLGRLDLIGHHPTLGHQSFPCGVRHTVSHRGPPLRHAARPSLA